MQFKVYALTYEYVLQNQEWILWLEKNFKDKFESKPPLPAN